jgi:hypothetical protein
MLGVFSLLGYVLCKLYFHNPLDNNAMAKLPSAIPKQICNNTKDDPTMNNGKNTAKAPDAIKVVLMAAMANLWFLKTFNVIFFNKSKRIATHALGVAKRSLHLQTYEENVKKNFLKFAFVLIFMVYTEIVNVY